MSFERAVAFTLSQEGGEVNDPADPGGLTKWGISQRAYPALDIAGLTREHATDLYEADYWTKGRCEQLPWPLSLAHFDAGVNMGLGLAAKLLQRALGLFPADGIIGPETLARVQMIADDPAAVRAVTYRQLLERVFAYRRIGNLTFLRSWIVRVEDLYRLVLTS